MFGQQTQIDSVAKPEQHHRYLGSSIQRHSHPQRTFQRLLGGTRIHDVLVEAALRSIHVGGQAMLPVGSDGANASVVVQGALGGNG